MDTLKSNPLSGYLAHLEESSDAIFSRGFDKRIISWNSGAARMFGYTKQEAEGKKTTEIGYFIATNDFIEQVERKVLDNGFWESELSFFHKDGHKIIGAVSANAIKNESGEVISFLFVIKDISRIKQLESELKEANEALEAKVIIRTKELKAAKDLYHNIFKNSPMPMWIFDIKTKKFLDINELAIKVYGYTREEFLAMTLMDIRTDEEKELLKQLNLDDNSENFNQGIWKHRLKNGNIIYVEIVAHPIQFNGVEAKLVLANNVTQRVTIEKQIETNEKRFRALIENSHDGITLMDENATVLYRSPSTERITGRSEAEMKGIDATTHIHPDDLIIIQNTIHSLLESPGKLHPIAFRNKHKDGHYIIVEGVIINLLDNKNINAIVFNYRDVTEKRTALDKLAGSELRFRTLLENGNDIVSLFDENFRIIYRSPSAFKVMGWSDEEMLNEKWTKNIHPNDLEIADYTVKAILENLNIPVDVSIRMKHKLGYYLWVEGKIVNLMQDEKIKAIVFNFRDITERKLTADELFASEKQYRSLVERISDAFVTLDNDLCFTYMNTVAEEMFDVETGYLLGKKMYEEYSTGVGGDIFKAVHLALNSKTSQRFDSYSDVFNKWITGSIYPSETGLTCFFRDTTEIKKMELNLLEQKHKEQTKLISATLEAQEKERNAIGIELHDNVNQILVGTTMFLSMLKKKSVKDDALIDECIDNIKSAINENRKIAHVLVGPDLENKHIGDQIKSLCESMLEVNGIKSITHFENYDFTLIPKEKKVALYRIVQELFTNIIKYAEATEVNIYLLTANEKVLSMRVADNGKGMDQKKVTSGIGLRNIKSRLVVFDGEMKIVTEPGKGFALEVEIPLG